MQELKLSEDNCIVPEQEVLDVFVVTEEVSIDSEKVIEIPVPTEIDVVELFGVTEETIGGVVSGCMPVVNPFDVSY
jgi:hypothetical protein